MNILKSSGGGDKELFPAVVQVVISARGLRIERKMKLRAVNHVITHDVKHIPI